MEKQFVQSTDRWKWLNVEMDGHDLVVRGCRATNFGHKSDSQDSGIGSHGWPVSDHPTVPVVALPYRVAAHAQFRDSPLPALAVKSPTQAGTVVRVHCPATGKSVQAELADLGPSLFVGFGEKRRYLRTGIDLSEATIHALGLTLGQGEYTVDYRIIGGARAL